MPRPRQLDGVLYQRSDLDCRPIEHRVLLRHARRAKHLLDRSHQPLGVGEHDLVELLPLLRHRSAVVAEFRDRAGSR